MSTQDYRDGLYVMGLVPETWAPVLRLAQQKLKERDMLIEICSCGHELMVHDATGCTADHCLCLSHGGIGLKNAEKEIRVFASGATRNSDADKLDYEGFLSPFVLRRFARYMHANRVQKDGTLRASDNWQKGLPPAETLKSLLRHVMEVWLHMRGVRAEVEIHAFQDALCAVIFNAQSLLLESLKEKGTK